MANFQGTTKEFMKFIGGYSRNKVQYITRNHRKKIGKCQECLSKTSKLDAAHITGKERPIIISDILKDFIDGEIVTVDLQEFEDRFLKAHDPIESTIRILCKKCHGEYDKVSAVPEYLPEELDLDAEKIEEREAEIVEKLINTSEMNKSKAIEFINSEKDGSLIAKNTIYSSQNAAIDVWWLEPKNLKFTSELNFVLNNANNNTLYQFCLQPAVISNPEIQFDQRSEKSASKIIIPISDTVFKDKKGFDFTPFLINRLVY
ncbi:hypothetical protein [Flavobacterium sp.]|uniref:hypothetical protein n=1 Tax=Flavobacterium sp. TaxID=239 RepID=UPI002B4B2BC7|nr:hypothetical protein [Flavobacterium sp.]HLF53242.1 hypothetical protein [Flavobacterium sp.]